MKQRALDFLVCPIDKTQLELREWETLPITLSREEMCRVERLGLAPTLFNKEIVSGVLVNRARKIFYPIHNGIPRLLTFPTGVVSDFTKQNFNRISRELTGFTTPHETAMPGEETVLRTFSSEWLNYDWNEQSYWNLTAEGIYNCMEFLLDLVHRPVKDKLVLEIGIGIGGIADNMLIILGIPTSVEYARQRSSASFQTATSNLSVFLWSCR